MADNQETPKALTSSKLAINDGRPVRANMVPPQSPYGVEERNAVMRVMDSGSISSFRGGKEVRAFEEEYADFIKTSFAIATTSGTTALHAALSALNLDSRGQSDVVEVAVPAVTFVSTASVVLQENLNPLFIDVDDTFCMDPVDLENKITERTKAIIPVHLYGQPANMEEILRVAGKNDARIIEDAAQAHGASYKGTMAGALGSFGCFSMFEFKNMACGEGGMITVSDADLYKEARLMREHGSSEDSNTWYNYQRLGYNYNMTELQAAIGREQLKKLPEKNRRRKYNAALYRDKLSGAGLEFLEHRPDIEHVHHLFPVLLPPGLGSLRDEFVAALQAEGIALSVAYPHPLYKEKVFQDRSITGLCPNAEDKTGRLFTLFTDAGITDEVIDDTARAIEKVLECIPSQLG